MDKMEYIKLHTKEQRLRKRIKSCVDTLKEYGFEIIEPERIKLRPVDTMLCNKKSKKGLK